MKNLICVLLLCGCGGKFEVETKEPKIPSVDFTVTVQAFEVKQDHAISMLNEVKSRVGDLLLRSDDTKKRLESLEAKLIVPKPQREEVIKSAIEPQGESRANLSQPNIPVASPPAVRSSSSGVKLSWNVEGNWNPTILETAKHLREDHGIIADGMTHQQMHDTHAALHEGRQVAIKTKSVQMINRGSSCPGGVCPTRQTTRMRWRR